MKGSQLGEKKCLRLRLRAAMNRKKYTFSLKIITFNPNKQIGPNKLIKLKQSNRDNTKFL